MSSSQNKWLTPSHWQKEKSQLTEPCLDGWLADPVGLISSDILVDLATKQKKVSPCYFVDGALLSSQIKTCVHILSSLNYIHHFIHQLTHHTSQFSVQTFKPLIKRVRFSRYQGSIFSQNLLHQFELCKALGRTPADRSVGLSLAAWSVGWSIGWL